MKKVVIFGHRGVGKTAFLKRLKSYLNNSMMSIYDLDQEIENKAGLKIPEIFRTQGEAVFRGIEKNCFAELYQKSAEFIISVGGGFPVSEVPADVHCIWLQRPSDKSGRIFFDRPKLNMESTDLQEFQARFEKREVFFFQRANEQYLMPEGIRSGLVSCHNIEKEIFAEKIKFDSSTFITIAKRLYDQPVYLDKVIDSGWELRDDLLETQEIRSLLEKYKENKVLISFRSANKVKETSELLRNIKASTDKNIITDWALELGDPRSIKLDSHAGIFCPDILSLHEFEKGEKINDFLKRLESFADPIQHLKASPIIEDWNELEVLLDWQQQDPQHRSILPRSAEGRWTWVRLFLKGRQKINFWKDAQGSAMDQPSLFQWLSTPVKPSCFAAVLGSPVALSRTPVEQQDFFARFTMPVFAIELSEEDFPIGIRLLIKYGLVAAALTSPLKKIASSHFEISQGDQDKVKMTTINTIGRDRKDPVDSWRSTNTDIEGFAALAKRAEQMLDYNESQMEKLHIIVWGGGGTLPVIRSVYPWAVEYSLRTGLPRELTLQINSETQTIDILVWAAGPLDKSPPENLQPRIVVDLNYREDSLARSYAKEKKAKYLSGELMFEVQAKYQRQFWSSLEMFEKDGGHLA